MNNQPVSQQPPYPPHPIYPRSPVGGLFLSMIIPGAGSMYGGEVAIGVIIQCAWLVSLLLCLIFIGFITAPIIWVLGMWHGFYAVTNWNRQRGITS